MSTRAYVGIVNGNGTVTAIYTHSDGYPKHHRPILLDHYATEPKVRRLIALGALSWLGAKIGRKHSFEGRIVASVYAHAVRVAARDDATPYSHERLAKADKPDALSARAEAEDWCLAYGRDRGEEGQQPQTFASVSEFERECQKDYTYLFDRGVWRMRHWDGPWSCLANDECKRRVSRAPRGSTGTIACDAPCDAPCEAP